MMAYHDNAQVNLAVILQTLSNGGSANKPPPAGFNNFQNAWPPPSSVQSTPVPLLQPYAPAQIPNTAPTHLEHINRATAPRPESSVPKRPPSAPPIDPRTIVSWPPALRFVTKLLTKDEAAMARVRSLIQSQHKHERDWHRGREALVENQKTRRKAEDEVASVLFVTLHLKMVCRDAEAL